MRRGIIILLCISMIASLCLPVSADGLRSPANLALNAPTTPKLSSSTVTQPTVPNPDSLPILSDPRLEIMTFTAPKDLKLVKAEKNMVSIQWTDTAIIETKYVVERKKSGGSYTQLAVLGKDAASYNDTSVESGATYYYRVKAGKEDSYTGYSNELTVNVPSPTVIIKDPAGDLLNLGGIKKPPIGIDPRDIKITTPGTTPGTSDPGTTTEPGTPSDPGTTTDPGTAPGTTDPSTAAPTGINAPEALAAEAISESQIAFTWQDKSDNESGFLLYRTATGEWEQAAVMGSDTTEYTDENLQPNTTYYYVLYAYNDTGASTESNLVEIATLEPAPVQAATPTPTATLAAPEALTAQAQAPTEVVLTWQDKSSNEEGFLLYRTSTGEWEQIAVVSANTAGYTDKAVQPNTKYYYVIYAYIGQTPSKESNIAEITTSGQAAAVAVDFTGASSWALEELKKAVEYGLYTERIMNNYNQNITREEFCELVIKLYEKLKGTAAVPASPNTFIDTTNESILKAYGSGIVNGTGKDTFSPNNPITRQDICVMLYRAINGAVSNVDVSISGVPTFADENQIGTWAVKEVKFAYKNNIMKGSDSKIMPKDNTNREQALLLVKRVYEIFATFGKLAQ